MSWFNWLIPCPADVTILKVIKALGENTIIQKGGNQPGLTFYTSKGAETFEWPEDTPKAWRAFAKDVKEKLNG